MVLLLSAFIVAAPCFLIMHLYDMGWMILIAAVLSCVYAALRDRYYQNHDYYRKEQFFLLSFSLAFTATSIVLAVYCFLSSPPASSIDVALYAITSTLIAIVTLVILHISDIRHAGSFDNATQRATESIIRYTEGIASYADYVIFYVKVAGSGATASANIKADVSTDGKTDTFTVCIGGVSDLERFASYAKTHYRRVSNSRNGVVSITFPLH